MPETSLKTRAGALALALLLAAPLAARAGEPEGEKEKEKEVHVVKVHKECKGGDCEGERRIVRRIKIGDAEGGGEKMVWIDRDGEGHVVFAGPHGKGGFLGVGLTELTPELRTHFGAPADAGVMVSKVVSGSPAERAGVRVGDIIAAVDGAPVSGAGSLAGAIRKRGDGETVALEVWRDGKLQTLSATLEERERLSAHHMRKLMIDCDDDGPCAQAFALGEDFDFDFASGFDCGDGDDCKVEVDCDDGDCDCRINGKAADCATIPGFRGGKE